MPERLSDEVRQSIVRNRRNNVSASRIAGDLGVSDRHVHWLWKRHQKTDGTRLRMSRLGDCITEAQVWLVTDAYREQPVGVLRVARELRKNHDISYNRVYRVLKKSSMMVESAARSKRRK